jgi:Flp pilus assembly CpaF family ATPase
MTDIQARAFQGEEDAIDTLGQKTIGSMEMAFRVDLVQKIRAEAAEDIAMEESTGLDIEDRKEFARSIALARLRAVSAQRIANGLNPLGTEEEQHIAQEVLDSLFGLGRLQALVEDERIENIDVNGCDTVWATREDGSKMLCPPVASSDDELISIIQNAAARLGHAERRFDTAHPELDLRLPDGSRLSALMSVTKHPVLSIRRHRFIGMTLSDLVERGTLNAGLASFLSAAVRARKNLIIAGAMNAGKTTLMRALCNEIPPRERIVTIEQAFELGLDTMPDRYPDLIAMEARQANAEGAGEITVSRLVRRSLRMNADRVIVGEVLGDEIIPMLNAMSQGRSGSMCTIHADSSEGVFRRIASYAIQAQERLPVEAANLLIAGAIHFVIFLDVSLGEDGSEESTDGCYRNGGNDGDHDGNGYDGHYGNSKIDGMPDKLDGRQNYLHGHRHEERLNGDWPRFRAVRRLRFVSSVREIIDAEGVQVISNEIFRPSHDRRAVEGAPLRAQTLDELVEHGYDPAFNSTGGPNR